MLADVNLRPYFMFNSQSRHNHVWFDTSNHQVNETGSTSTKTSVGRNIVLHVSVVMLDFYTDICDYDI